jgi:UDP-glucose 4-epimerase
MSMRVLVTGAAGRIGRHVVRLLSTRGHHVRSLDQRPSDTGEVMVGSLLDPADVRTATLGVDAVVHLAALMTWDPGAEDALFEQNVSATYRLLRALPAGLARFVFASSGEVYPERKPAYLPIDEDHPLAPDNAYGLSKLLGEEMVRQRMRVGLKATIVRLAHTQAAEELLDPASAFSGPRFFVTPRIRLLESLPPTPAITEALRRLREVQEPGDQLLLACSAEGVPYRMGICDARDAAAGIVLALEHPRAEGGVFNIGPKSSVDFGDIVPLMGKLSGLPVVKVSLPLPAYRYETSIARARQVLGYEPRHTVEQMIQEAAAARAARSRASGVPLAPPA